MSAGLRLPKGIQMKEGLKMNRSSLEMTVTSTSSCSSCLTARAAVRPAKLDPRTRTLGATVGLLGVTLPVGSCLLCWGRRAFGPAVGGSPLVVFFALVSSRYTLGGRVLSPGRSGPLDPVVALPTLRSSDERDHNVPRVANGLPRGPNRQAGGAGRYGHRPDRGPGRHHPVHLTHKRGDLDAQPQRHPPDRRPVPAPDPRPPAHL